MVDNHPGDGSRYFGPKATELVDIYASYLQNAGSVDSQWQAFFGNLQDEARELLNDMGGFVASQSSAEVFSINDVASDEVRASALRSIRALMLIRAYRVRGHLEAHLDPLGLKLIKPHPELDPQSYGFSDADMDTPIFINGAVGLEVASINQIMGVLRETYCKRVGIEFMHIQVPEQKAWIQERVESFRNSMTFSDEGKKTILGRLTAAEVFENFLNTKYTGTKRFGLDGGESMIPALEQILEQGSRLGLEEVVLGMPHRGRLNVLANFMGKPFRAIFNEFRGGASNPEDVGGSGDVKYHLGTSSDREFDGRNVHLSLAANPSHLEAVNPVVVGKVRAKQHKKGDRDFTKTMALLMHGDAAFSGQGLVPETLDLSELKGYRIGGTIHFVVNNQIGFTTDSCGQSFRSVLHRRCPYHSGADFPCERGRSRSRGFTLHAWQQNSVRPSTRMS